MTNSMPTGYTAKPSRTSGSAQISIIRRSAVLNIAVDAFARKQHRFISTVRPANRGSVQVGNTIEPPDLRILQTKKSSATMAQLVRPNCRETGGFGRSHSLSFDHRFRPDTLRTAMATAFFCPTSTTSFLPRVTPV
jgi:hypothetical protein